MTCRMHALVPYLCFTRLAILVGDANLIEEAMELTNDGVDLLRQVAGIHRGG